MPYIIRILAILCFPLSLQAQKGKHSLTLQEELAKNGSPRAFIETDEDRSYFLMYIPVHEGCGNVVTLKEQKEDLHKDYPKIAQRLHKAHWN